MFLVYEYIITADREVTLFWNGRMDGATVLFLSNRYLTLIVNMWNLVEFGQFTDEVRIQY